jgi:hypothetical protein
MFYELQNSISEFDEISKNVETMLNNKIANPQRKMKNSFRSVKLIKSQMVDEL